VPSTGEVAANFKAPPREYGAIQPFPELERRGPRVVRANIVRDLDRLSANGIFIVNMSPGRRSPAREVSVAGAHGPGGSYGRGGGKAQHAALDSGRVRLPQRLCGRLLSASATRSSACRHHRGHHGPRGSGETLTMPVPSNTLAIMALESDAQQQVEKVIPIPFRRPAVEVADAGRGVDAQRAASQLAGGLVRHVYLSSPTRNFNRADGTRAKDGTTR